MTLRRRDTVSIVAATLVASVTMAEAGAPPEIIPLWPGAPPGGGRGPAGPERMGRHGQITNVQTPRLIVRRPERPNGMAVIVIGGGGYHSIGLERESDPAACWLCSLGITAFELIYRFPDERWPRNATFADGLRAVRLVRARAAQFGLDKRKIGILGFSAGGHLAGMTAVGSALGTYPPVDDVDVNPARPDFAMLIYPVLTMMPPWNGTQVSQRLVGADGSNTACLAYSVERQVTPSCPPVFLAQSADDPIAPVENSLLMFGALRRCDLLPEMHIFRQGGHGWGLGEAGSEVAAWPMLCAKWIAQLAIPG